MPWKDKFMEKVDKVNHSKTVDKAWYYGNKAGSPSISCPATSSPRVLPVASTLHTTLIPQLGAATNRLAGKLGAEAFSPTELC